MAIITGGLVLGMNTIMRDFFNSDYDGDNVSVFCIHSKQGKDDFKYAYSKNNIEFEHKDKLIVNFEHESIYALYKLTLMGCKPWNDLNKQAPLSFETINDFKVDLKMMKDYPNVEVNIVDCNISLPYNIMVLNKAALSDGINNIPLCKENLIFEREEVIPNNKLQDKLKKILKLCGNNYFYDYMHNFNKFLLEAGTLLSYANPTYDSKHFIVESNNIINYKKTLVNEPFIGFHQNDILFTDIIKPLVDEDEDNILSDVFKSGARIKSVQLLKAASNNGIPTDINGKAYFINIKESLLDGLPKYTFFKASDSARLSLAQKQSAIPKGGELQRKFYHETGFLQEAKESDCGTERFFKIHIKNSKHLKSLNGRYIKSLNGLEILDHTDLSLIDTTIDIRSPIYCLSENFGICKTCLGKKRPMSVNTGAAIGSYIPEAIIQSVLRSHHFSGAFITDINPEMMNLIKKLNFGDSDKIYIYNNEEKINMDKLLDLLRGRLYYDDKDGIKIEFKLIESNEGNEFDTYQIIVNDLPFNDDSVKQLHNIISYIDRNRYEENLIELDDMYEFLCENITFPNNIYSLLIELIISILYYYEDTPLRYTEDGIYNRQIALGRIIETIDPKLSIFHNFSKNIINKIYSNKNDYNLDHMHYELIDHLK